MEVKETFDLNSLSEFGNKEHVNKVGKIIVESLRQSGRLEPLAEKLGVKKEALDVGDSQLYTTAIAGFIEKRLRPKLVAAGVIKRISNFNTKGSNSVKIPVRNSLITAADLPDDGSVSYDSGTFASTTITLSYKYAANSITHEISKFANVDLMAEELGEIGDAIARKMDSDVISALKSATTSGNSNLTQLGATATVTFDNLIDGQASAFGNYAEPDVLLANHSTLATIMKEVQVTGGTNAPGALTNQGEKGSTFPYLRTVLGMNVVGSQQVDGDDIFLIDSARTGYLIESGDVEVFDGRRSGYVANEVIGAKCYGVGVVQPKAVYRLEENAGA